MEKISVIVPIYNVEEYLERCIKTIINQTYKDLEIILVDDGSTDSSGKICDNYAKKDNRIVVIHKKNGGLSDARNAGIDKSTGKYLYFIDSDDYIELNMLEDLYHNCVDNSCEIAISNKFIEYDEKNFYEQKSILADKVADSIEALELLLLSDPAIWNKLFLKDLFNNIRFPKGKLYEDIITTPFLFEKAKRVYFNSNSYYHYIQRNNSIVHKKFSLKKMDYAYNAKELYNLILKKYDTLIEQANAYYILVLTTSLTDIYKERKKYRKEYQYLIDELKKFKKIYKNNKYINKLKKIMVWCDLHRLIFFVNIIKNIRKR